MAVPEAAGARKVGEIPEQAFDEAHPDNLDGRHKGFMRRFGKSGETRKTAVRGDRERLRKALSRGARKA